MADLQSLLVFSPGNPESIFFGEKATVSQQPLWHCVIHRQDGGEKEGESKKKSA